MNNSVSWAFRGTTETQTSPVSYDFCSLKQNHQHPNKTQRRNKRMCVCSKKRSDVQSDWDCWDGLNGKGAHTVHRPWNADGVEQSGWAVISIACWTNHLQRSLTYHRTEIKFSSASTAKHVTYCENQPSSWFQHCSMTKCVNMYNSDRKYTCKMCKWK